MRWRRAGVGTHQNVLECLINIDELMPSAQDTSHMLKANFDTFFHQKVSVLLKPWRGMPSKFEVMRNWSRRCSPLRLHIRSLIFRGNNTCAGPDSSLYIICKLSPRTTLTAQHARLTASFLSPLPHRTIHASSMADLQRFPSSVVRTSSPDFSSY